MKLWSDHVHQYVSRAMGLKVITRESLWAAQREDLQKVMELLSVREHHARSLLIHYRWNAEKLITVYFEEGESRVFKEAGVRRDEFVVVNQPESSCTVLCNICMDDVASSALTKMDCGHCFCNSCWTEHFIVKINEGQSKRIRCMAHECNAICDEAVIRSLVSTRHLDLAERFERFLLESYIEDNPLVKWCPSVPHCGNAIQVENDEFCEVECCCGLQFCFSCLSEPHSPCSCSMWQHWTQKCRDEFTSVKWIDVNTMRCPKCHTAVEKISGCNLVRCVCGQPFCWLCGEATGIRHTWFRIDNHSCGRFAENTEKKSKRAKRDVYMHSYNRYTPHSNPKKKRKRAKRDPVLSRYMHYYNHYKAHSKSFQLESQLWESIKDKVRNLQSRDSKERDFSWIASGFHRLLTSRRALLYSYPFVYFAFGDDFFKDGTTEEKSELKRYFFVDQQQQLELNVEKLSEILEEPLDEYSDEQVRQIQLQVIYLSVNADNLCRRMYECIQSELLDSLQFIAPYQSKGIEKAGDKCPEAAGQSPGDSMEMCQASTSSNILPSKRHRNESSSSGHRECEMCYQLSHNLLQLETQGTS